MTTRIEKQQQSTMKEIEKLETRIEKAKARLEKKQANAIKYNANWTKEEWFKVRENGVTDEQWKAYFDMSLARGEVEELEKKLEKKRATLRTETKQVEKLNKRKAQDEADREIAEEIERWKEVGINITEWTSTVITGTTPSENTFSIYSNNGFTKRSRKCFTLRINYEMVFTSGEWITCFKEIKNS